MSWKEWVITFIMALMTLADDVSQKLSMDHLQSNGLALQLVSNHATCLTINDSFENFG